MNQTDPNAAPCDVRFGQVGLACVRVRNVDAAAICADLERRVITSPDLFARTAVIVDLSHLPALPDDGMVDAILEAIRTAGMLPIGLAYGDSATEELAQRMGLPTIAKFREFMQRTQAASAAPPPPTPEPEPEPRPEPVAAAPAASGELALQHMQNVRSGQQVYAKERDLVIVGNVANGAEIIADGSIHVYGRLLGKALAGASGDAQARIYCTQFAPELVSIGGSYRVFEQVAERFTRTPVMVRLADGKLLIDRI